MARSTGSTRLRAVPNVRTLAGWKSRWIQDETTIHCPVCLASQSINQAQAPFCHQPGCSRCSAEFSEYPWQDLALILRQEVLDSLQHG